MKTIAQQLNVNTFPFRIKDDNDNVIYYEESDGDWHKREYDTNRNVIYFENSDKYWTKREFDDNNNEIYHENYRGEITDNRTLELTLDDIAKKFNIDVKKLKVIK